MRTVLILLAAALLAGCAQPASDDPPADPAAQAAAFEVEDGVSGCWEGAVALLVEPDAAADLLPDGFTPADAAGLFGVDAATGRAAIYSFIQTCEASERFGSVREGELAVYVQPPDVAGTRDPAFDFYPVYAVMEEGPLLDHFANVSWPYVPGTVELTASELPNGGARITGSASDADGVVFSFTGELPATNALDGIGRFWQHTDAGLAYVDHRITTGLAAGPATCELREGTPAAEALGRTTCVPGDAVGLALLPFEYHATYVVVDEA